MNKIGDAQFRVMCDMWGVDNAIIAAKRMGLTSTQEQIDAAKQKEIATQERWNSVFKKEQKEG
jgi:hypothetical protein